MALKGLGALFGRILMECFTTWWSEHPDVRENQGFLFAQNFSESLNQIQGNLDLGLKNKVDFFTISQAFFYSDESSHYYYSKNLGSSYTFLELWKKIDEELGINCNNPNRILCKIKSYLGSNEDYVKDFRISENLFMSQYYFSEHYIPRNIYYTDSMITKITKQQSPNRFLNFPTFPQFERKLVDKDLNIRDIGIDRYGMNIYDGENYPDENGDKCEELGINFSYGLFMDSFWHSENKNVLAGKVLNVDEISTSPDYFMIWPSIPTSKDFNRAMFYCSLTDKHLDFYPYSRQPFNLTNKIYNKNKKVNIGDRYYRIEEEEERGGYSTEYKTAWIFSQVTNSVGNVASNLTDFAHCLSNKSYYECKMIYLPWFSDCPSNQQEICDLIIKNLASLNKTTVTASFKKNILLNYCILGFFCLFCVLLFISLMIKDLSRDSPGYESV